MSLLGGPGRGGGSTNPAVIKWDDGEITEFDLERMLRMRAVLNHFVQTSWQLGAMASGSEGSTPPDFKPVSERAVVQTALFAKAAQDQGFVVSDATINGYIKRITNDSVTPARLREIIAKRSIGNMLVTMDTIFAGLRTELLAQALIGNYLVAADSATPLELWLQWQRLNDRAIVEVAAVPVASFVSQVADPTDGELQTFYDTYKDVVKRPVVVAGTQLESPQPGFKVPPQVALAYVRADYERFVDKLMPEVTDQEITEYYEQNKRNFVRPTLLDDQGEGAAGSEPAPSTGQGVTAEPATTEPATTEPAPPAETKTPEATEEAKPDLPSPDGPKPDGPKLDEPKSDEPKPDEPKSDEPKPDEPKPDEPQPDEPKPDEDDQTGWARRSPFRLVGEQKEEGPNTEASEAEGPDVTGSSGHGAENAETTEPAATEPAVPQPASPAETTGQQGDSAEPQPGEAASELALPAPAGETAGGANPAGAASTAAGEAAAGTSSTGQEPEPQYASLEEVKDEIRRDIARRQAPEKMDAVLELFRPQLRRYFDDLQVWMVEYEDKQQDAATPPRPTVPDAAAWAKENDLVFETTPLMSNFELAQEDLGQSVVIADGRPLVTEAFDVLEDYKPVVTADRLGNRYLAWRVKATTERIPKLEEIRQQVITAWKMEGARELARKEAQRLADMVRSASQPMADVLTKEKGYNVIRSDPFSWYTVGPVPGGRQMRIRLSQVYGVDGAGMDFMKAVFQLEEGQVDVAENHAQTICYVVRLASREQSRSAMHEDFLRDYEVLGQIVRQQNSMQMISTLLRELQESQHVEGWETLDTQRERDSAT
jgi:hypothetical protein